jgi:molybdopterin-guanine dinucleotide biosynthesis protein A
VPDFAVYILAGGMGRRFGGDKLLALVDGNTAISRIASSAWESGAESVYVVTKNEKRCKLYSSEARLTGCLYDSGVVGEGPADGFYTAIHHATSIGVKRAVILPGDTPWITPGVVEGLYSGLALAPATTVLHESGFIESLMAGVETSNAHDVLRLVKKLSVIRGYARPCDYYRLSPRTALVGSSLLAYTAMVFADINTRENVRIREPKNRLGERGITVFSSPLRHGVDGPEDLCEVLRREERLYTSLGLLHFKLKASKDYYMICSKNKKE